MSGHYAGPGQHGSGQYGTGHYGSGRDYGVSGQYAGPGQYAGQGQYAGPGQYERPRAEPRYERTGEIDLSGQYGQAQYGQAQYGPRSGGYERPHPAQYQQSAGYEPQGQYETPMRVRGAYAVRAVSARRAAPA